VQIRIEISPAELFDKISILEIKLERISDAQKRTHIRQEHRLLVAVRDKQIPASPALEALVSGLKTVNLKLWDIEDAIRVCEREGDFGRRFVALARSVYKNNDERAELKRRINTLLKSSLFEEKSYTSYA